MIALGFPRSQAQATHAAYLPTLKSSAGSMTRIEGIFRRIGKGGPIKNTEESSEYELTSPIRGDNRRLMAF